MTNLLLFIGLILAAAFLGFVLRSFEYMDNHELKRQARRGNIKAARVYAVRGVYRVQLWIFLTGFMGLLTVGAMVTLFINLYTWLAASISFLLFELLFLVIPRIKKPINNLSLAAKLSPILEKLLHAVKFINSPLARALNKIILIDLPKKAHSKSEILEILENTNADNQISEDEVRIAVSALTFDDDNIGKVMTPLSVVKKLKDTDVLTPVMLDELHDSGFSRFPVQEKSDGYVGILYLKDAINMDTSHTVKNIMKKEVYYVNEAASLGQALRAILKTQHHMLLVVNEYEDVVGVITVEDIMERIIGKKIVDEFDDYEDLREVAKSLAEKESKEPDHV